MKKTLAEVIYREGITRAVEEKYHERLEAFMDAHLIHYDVKTMWVHNHPDIYVYDIYTAGNITPISCFIDEFLKTNCMD